MEWPDRLGDWTPPSHLDVLISRARSGRAPPPARPRSASRPPEAVGFDAGPEGHDGSGEEEEEEEAQVRRVGIRSSGEEWAPRLCALASVLRADGLQVDEPER